MTYRLVAIPALVGAAFVLFVPGALLLIRRLPSVRGRMVATVPAMAVGAVCATVLGLIVGQLLRVLTDGADLDGALLQLSAALGAGVSAALVCGLVAGVAAGLTLRVAVGRSRAVGSLDGGQVRA